MGTAGGSIIMHIKRIAAVAIIGGSVAIGAAPALAAHDHYVVTPNGSCHRVASGQTAIADPAHGGYHQFHDHVHVGATESSIAPDTLGDGNAVVNVYRDTNAPAQCTGS
jgi:hypothetical protein